MPGEQAAAAAPRQQQGFSWFSAIVQMLVIYACFTYMNPFRSVANIEDAADAINLETETIIEAPLDGSAPPVVPKSQKKPKQKLYNAYSKGDELHMKMFYVEDSKKAFHTVLHERTVTLSSYADDQYETLDISIPMTPHLLNNGSASICTVFGKTILPSNFTRIQSQPDGIHKFTECNKMVVYQEQRKFVPRQNLMTGEWAQPDESVESAAEELKIVSFWKPNITLSLVDDFTQYASLAKLPPQVKDRFRFLKDSRAYLPIVYYNEFWLLHENLMAINDSLESLPLTISLEPLSLTKFTLYAQFSQSLEMQKSFGSTDKDLDDIKLMLFETNPYLLGVTVIVSLLHTIFDTLAFKNDITYWKNKKSMVGMSVRTIFMNVISQFIVFLYLWDNDTSFMILFSVGIGILIELWKITKAVNVSVDRSGAIPKIRFKDKESYCSITKKYDDLAFKYLGYALFPLVIGYSIYSLYYETHRSWYSWILASLTGCVYTFGFIMMTPQLFINYKLKSVAHLPWRTFTYKALNTFIDDLFAFIIRMPTLHRLACFRDDLVFFIFLFQLYLYPKDKRRNEYGEFIEEEKEEEKEEGSEEVIPKKSSDKTQEVRNRTDKE